MTYRSPTELTVPPNNPRFHPPRQIKQIARSISTFGFLLPIVVDEADRVLVGIGRLLLHAISATPRFRLFRCRI